MFRFVFSSMSNGWNLIVPFYCTWMISIFLILLPDKSPPSPRTTTLSTEQSLTVLFLFSSSIHFCVDLELKERKSRRTSLLLPKLPSTDSLSQSHSPGPSSPGEMCEEEEVKADQDVTPKFSSISSAFLIACPYSFGLTLS